MADIDGLLARVGTGDRSAFEAVYDETADLVYGIARRIVVDPELAREVAQEVFLEVWRKADRYDPTRGSARTWVAVMTKRRAIDVVRASQASRDREEANPEGVDLPGDPVGDVVVDTDDRARVAAALTGLTDLQREALDLAFYGGLTHREVAGRLDVPLGTVKTRIRDGLQRLSLVMGDSDG